MDIENILEKLYETGVPAGDWLPKITTLIESEVALAEKRARKKLALEIKNIKLPNEKYSNSVSHAEDFTDAVYDFCESIITQAEKTE